MKLAIAGSRGVLPSITAIDVALDRLRYRWPEWRLAPVTAVISGTAEGADKAGEAWARHHGIPVVPVPADWAHLGKRAGHVRNRQMASIADVGIVFWDGVSGGAANMAACLACLEKPCHVLRWPWPGMGEDR